MNDKISTLHRVILWVCAISSFIFGVAYYVAPGPATSLLNVNAPDPTAITSIGGFLIAAFIGAAFSLKSGLWSEVRIPTYYLMTWGLLNGLRILLFVVTQSDFSLLPNAINSLIIGIGLGCAVLKQKSLAKK